MRKKNSLFNCKVCKTTLSLDLEGLLARIKPLAKFYPFPALIPHGNPKHFILIYFDSEGNHRENIEIVDTGKIVDSEDAKPSTLTYNLKSVGDVGLFLTDETIRNIEEANNNYPVLFPIEGEKTVTFYFAYVQGQIKIRSKIISRLIFEL